MGNAARGRSLNRQCKVGREAMVANKKDGKSSSIVNARISKREVILGAAATAIIASPFIRPTRAASGLVPVRLGYQSHLWGAPAVVALERQCFKEQGLTVADQKFASGKETRDAMVAGSADIGTVGIGPFIVGATLGDMTGIAAVCYAGKSGLVMAKKGSGIKTIGDLKGKRIASQIGSSLDSTFKSNMAPSAGLKPTDYELINAKFSDHVQAIASGSADAFLGLEPFCSISEAEGIAEVVTDYYKYDLIPNILAVQTSFLNANPETCVAFMRGWLKAVKLFKDDPRSVEAIMLKVYQDRSYNINPGVIGNAISRLNVTPEFIPELPDYITREAQALVKSGRLPSIPDPKKILRTDILQKAMGA